MLCRLTVCPTFVISLVLGSVVCDRMGISLVLVSEVCGRIWCLGSVTGWVYQGASSLQCLNFGWIDLLERSSIGGDGLPVGCWLTCAVGVSCLGLGMRWCCREVSCVCLVLVLWCIWAPSACRPSMLLSRGVAVGCALYQHSCEVRLVSAYWTGSWGLPV